ncbi:MAG: undecaprenyl-diphosphate phosphatase [Candidatus Tectomicrobia bacterium]|nr:undecaprenyl-diphosphate phosphatase [Candidatus Tectomicrobia bacterium]
MFMVLSAVLLGVVEGLTEFLPVSSTGHMIVVGHLIDWHGPQAATFQIFIQSGAILAVAGLYGDRFRSLLRNRHEGEFGGREGLLLLGLTTLPALVFGALAHGYIKEYLFNPMTVAVGLGLGGIVILLVERLLTRPGRDGLGTLGRRDALLIGLCQCLSLWPGVSRAAATIIGGRVAGLERRTATEYSFLAAVPVMFAAIGYDLLKSREHLGVENLGLFAIGFVVAWLSARLAVGFFLRLLGNYTLAPFGWYRLFAAGAVLVLWR